MDFVVISIYRKPSPALRNDTPLAPNFRPSRPLRAQLSPPQLSSQTGSEARQAAVGQIQVDGLVHRTICLTDPRRWRPSGDASLGVGGFPRSATVAERDPRTDLTYRCLLYT